MSASNVTYAHPSGEVGGVDLLPGLVMGMTTSQSRALRQSGTLFGARPPVQVLFLLCADSVTLGRAFDLFVIQFPEL